MDSCIKDSTSQYDPSFESRVSITISGYWRVITSNGIPDHPIGRFPLLLTEEEAKGLSDEEIRLYECCCGRPTGLAEQDWTINPLRHKYMEYDLDCNNGHVQPDSGYHYHGFPTSLYDTIRLKQEIDEAEAELIVSRRRSDIVLLGWAFDGNPIYAEECGKTNLLKWYPRCESSNKVGQIRREFKGWFYHQPLIGFEWIK